MCGSCAMRVANSSVLVEQGYTTIIPSQEFVSDATYQDFMLWRCMSESKFKNALATVRIDDKTTLADKVKTAQDVRKLATYADNGQDMAKWSVSLKSLLGSIKFSNKELNKAECNIAFSK